MSQHNRMRRNMRAGSDPQSFPLVEVPADRPGWNRFPPEAQARAYMLGQCSVLLTREFGNWHLSIAHPSRYPTWDEIKEARYRLIPDEITMGLLLPPRREYINIHANCFQLVEIKRRENSLYYPETQ